jgi:outer membrane cobalamin receptor
MPFMPRGSRFTRSGIIWAVAAVLTTAPLRAQDQSTTAVPADVRVDEAVFVTATVTPVSPADLTRSVAILNRADLEALGLRSPIDGLRLIPGLDMRARGPLDVQTDVSIRGATFGQHLVLADGMRLNDSQSGHHNAEIPLPTVAIDRIEVVAGAGSAVHGADALGGTVNVITRRDPHALARVAVGQHGLFDVQASAAGGPLPDGWTLASWGSRSDGFMYDRDFALGGVAVRGSPASGLIVDVRHQRRAFGANGFYGPSPSKEWTDQTLAGVNWQTTRGAWTTTVRGMARNHGDHFRWDIARPGIAENRHRTNAVEGGVDLRRAVGRARLALGASTSLDRVRSSNLGNHDYGRVGAFAEVQALISNAWTIVGGLRADHYSTFGMAVSPTASVVTTVRPGLRLRASAGHAFRIPTFTELYYSDPNTLGRTDLRAEEGWTIDGGADWERGPWSATASVFGRWDQDVIDFVRPEPSVRFQATNVRDVRARGLEVSISRRWARALVRASYAALDIDAPDLMIESRYVLEYARHQTSLSVAGPLGAGLRGALTVDQRLRRDGQHYALVGGRVSRTIGRLDIFLDATNLFDVEYTEIAGVAMPGRWASIGVTIR